MFGLFVCYYSLTESVIVIETIDNVGILLYEGGLTPHISCYMCVYLKIVNAQVTIRTLTYLLTYTLPVNIGQKQEMER